MLTNPSEVVPLQIARAGLADSLLADRSLPKLSLSELSLPRLRGRVGVGVVGALLRAVLCAMHNILDSVRAAGGLAPSPLGRRLTRHLERDAQGVREPAGAGDEGADLGHGPLSAAGGRRLASVRPPRTPARRLADCARLGVPGADLFHRAIYGLSTRGALGCLSNRPRHGTASGGACGRDSAGRTVARTGNPGCHRVAWRDLGGPATIQRRVGPLAGAPDRSQDRGLHVTGPDWRPVGFTVDLWVASLAVWRDPAGPFYDGSPGSRVAPHRRAAVICCGCCADDGRLLHGPVRPERRATGDHRAAPRVGHRAGNGLGNLEAGRAAWGVAAGRGRACDRCRHRSFDYFVTQSR